MDLKTYYKINFDVTQYHKFSLFEIESMIPWEREIYVSMLADKVKEEEEKKKKKR